MKYKSIYLSANEQKVKDLALSLTHNIATFLSENQADKTFLLNKIISKLAQLLSEPIISRNNHAVHELVDDGSMKTYQLNNILELLLLAFNHLQDLKLNEHTSSTSIDTLYVIINKNYVLLTQAIGKEGWDKVIYDGTIEIRESIQLHVGKLLVPINNLLPSLFNGMSLKGALKSGEELVKELEAVLYMGHRDQKENRNPINFKKGDAEGIKDIIKRIKELLTIAEGKDPNMRSVAQKMLDLKNLVGTISNTNTHS